MKLDTFYVIYVAALAFIIIAAIILPRLQRIAYPSKPASGQQGTPVSETEEGKLFDIVGNKNECPDCHHHGFYEGPSGGMSTNIFCKNRDCRAGFNITPLGDGVGLCERISEGRIESYPKETTT